MPGHQPKEVASIAPNMQDKGGSGPAGDQIQPRGNAQAQGMMHEEIQNMEPSLGAILSQGEDQGANNDAALAPEKDTQRPRAGITRKMIQHKEFVSDVGKR